MSELTASLLIVGDEILDGYVRDENLGEAAAVLHKHGIVLQDVAVVRDTIEDVVGALEAALSRSRPRVVLTSGGLGPTQDDITLAAVATALGRPLREAHELSGPMESIVHWMESQGFELSEEERAVMMSIAQVPEGTEVVRHRRWLTAIVQRLEGGLDAPGGAAVISLPGPPGHFSTVLREAVGPQFLEGRGGRLQVRELEHDYPETLLAPCFRRARERCPGVTIGSYPGERMVVRVQGPPSDVEEAVRILRQGLADLDARDGAAAIRRAWRDDQAAAWSRQEGDS